MQISYKSELLRKFVHLLSLIIPIGYLKIDKCIFFTLLSLSCAIIMICDYFNLFLKLGKAGNFVHSKIYRAHETTKKSLSGSSYFLLSCLICSAFFNSNLFVFAISILVISDTTAALFGRQIPVYKFKSLSKSLGGMIGFIASGFIVARFFTELNIYSCIISIIVAAILEMFAKKIKLDDNLLIPISICLCYELLQY